MKKLLIILILFVGGCHSIKADGFSIGFLYLNTDIKTTSTQELGKFGQLHSRQSNKINEIIPAIFINFKFE